MRVSAESRRYIFFLIVVSVCVVLLALPSMDDIDVTWEHLNWNSAMAIRETGVPFVRPGHPLNLHHPPSWSYIIAASVTVFGESVWAMRLPGLLCFLATGLLLYVCARCLSLNRLVATLAATIYLTNPMALQGALN
ncbi:MAG: glycosyltransferase family 39 protein, partial [Lentisphaeria bacterium]|nr:glycosyltransferase family 39 protein [Lentisphaeria bacterium]